MSRFSRSHKYDLTVRGDIASTNIKINHICANCGWTHGEHWDRDQQHCPNETPRHRDGMIDHPFFKYYQDISNDREI